MDTNINNILIIKSKQEFQMGSFELVKFILSAKGEKNKTNKIASPFTKLHHNSVALFPLALEPSMNFNNSKLAYLNAKKDNSTGRCPSSFL